MVLVAATNSVHATVVDLAPMVAVRNRKAAARVKVMAVPVVSTQPPDVARIPKPVALNRRAVKVAKVARVRKGHRGVNAAKGNHVARKVAWTNSLRHVVRRATRSPKPSPERASDSRFSIGLNLEARRRIIGVGLLSHFS